MNLRCVIPVVLVQKQRILCVTRTVKHNYILPISTVTIQLHVSVLYVDHLQVENFNLQISYTICCGHLCGRAGRGGLDDVVSLTVLIGKIQLCLTVRVIHKNSLFTV